MKLKNRTALVTGATRGIGREIALRLAREGARLVLPLHNDWPEDSATLREDLAGSRQDHFYIEADLRKPDEVRNMAAATKKQIGSLDVLVNNIERGGMPVVHGPYDREINRDEWQLEMDTTLLAKRLVFESCLPLLKKAPHAAVVTISSIAGITGRCGPAGLVFSDGYAAANRGVSSFTETWARMGAPSVRVNELMVGLIDTRHGKNTRGWKSLSSMEKKTLTDHILLGKTGTPDEVAEAVMFLVSGANYMTGAVLRMDGGYVLGGDKAAKMPDGIL